MLLAAYELRCPTESAARRGRRRVRPRRLNDVGATVGRVGAILSEPRDDGWRFGDPKGETIREDDAYSGVRVAVPAQLASARATFNMDVNFGDPVWAAPSEVELPRLLGGTISVRGYPLEMIHAEKIVRAMQRGTANTRWGDFADIYLLCGHLAVEAAALSQAIRQVAEFRQTELVPLRELLDGYAGLAQARWSAWVRKQRLDERLPTDFPSVLQRVQGFADGVMAFEADGAPSFWDPARPVWR